MRILCTGGAGYIGSILVPRLLAAGHEVRVVDDFRYGQHLALAACCSHPKLEIFKHDARDYHLYSGLKADAIILLAAVVGASDCGLYTISAHTINFEAVSDAMGALSPDQLVIFPNTNSGYGTTKNGVVCDEDASLEPISLYGKTKCRAERVVMQRGNAIVFRLATVFGASPRMRTDLLVNDLTLRAVHSHAVSLYQPEARRNFVHIRDVADAFAFAIENIDAMRGRVFNLGNDDCNITKRQLCEEIVRHVPGFRWHEVDGEDPDRRDYLVSNARLTAAGFKASRGLDVGIAELLKLYRCFPQHQYGNV